MSDTEPQQPRAITGLERLEQTSDEVLAHIAEIHDFLTGLTTPAELRPIVLSAQAPRRWDRAGRVAPSFGLYNPNAFSVFVAPGGELPVSGGAFEVAARKLLVLPVAIRDVELGVNPADVAGAPALVHLLRYWTVQPAFLGG